MIFNRAYGSVHRAIHRSTGFPIAIKKVKIQSEEQRRSVETEIAILRVRLSGLLVVTKPLNDHFVDVSK